ncbi:F-box domain-containing protein [Phlyctema vagabunda]|uniref:F-box domain-containing protein n=1 Tax=Phlyctema vagabunda TaxID=108571 RepID=A0ABR4PZ10_9HELO
MSIDEMVGDTAMINILPPEILISILSSFSTRALLPMTPVSHRFHDVILRILQFRLHQAASVKDHQIILEAYHPSEKWATPFFLCEYLGTDEPENMESEDTGRLGKLSGMYSHFRPSRPEEDRREPRTHPAGGPLTTPSWLVNPPDQYSDSEGEFITQNLVLESHEMFSQLCSITNLVKMGPRKGLFLTSVNLGEDCLRLWRHWLDDQASASKSLSSSPAARIGSDKRVIWTGIRKDIGLKFQVSDRHEVQPTIPLIRGEEAPISYTLHYEEIVIRTAQLLLKLEQSLEQESQHKGKAIIFGSWL